MTRWVLGGGVSSAPGSRGVESPPLPPASPHMLPPPSSPVSRVVYNGKRNSSPRSPPNSSEIFTPAHEENVRFIYEGSLGAPRSPPPACPGWELHFTLPSPQGPGAGVTQGPCLVQTGSGNGVVPTVLFLLGSTPEGAAPEKGQHPRRGSIWSWLGFLEGGELPWKTDGALWGEPRSVPEVGGCVLGGGGWRKQERQGPLGGGAAYPSGYMCLWPQPWSVPVGAWSWQGSPRALGSWGMLGTTSGRELAGLGAKCCEVGD